MAALCSLNSIDDTAVWARSLAVRAVCHSSLASIGHTVAICRGSPVVEMFVEMTVALNSVLLVVVPLLASLIPPCFVTLSLTRPTPHLLNVLVFGTAHLAAAGGPRWIWRLGSSRMRPGVAGTDYMITMMLADVPLPPSLRMESCHRRKETGKRAPPRVRSTSGHSPSGGESAGRWYLDPAALPRRSLCLMQRRALLARSMAEMRDVHLQEHPREDYASRLALARGRTTTSVLRT